MISRAIIVLRCYNWLMWRVILREIFVLFIALALFPTAVILLLLHNDSVHTGLVFLYRALISGGSSPGSALDLWIKLFSPYLMIQAIRGFMWSRRSITGRKWANLYFALLLAGISAWFFSKAWDLFYFMYALGDMPAELKQFFELEGDSLLGSLLTLVLGIYCFSIFLNPYKGTKRNQFDSGCEES